MEYEEFRKIIVNLVEEVKATYDNNGAVITVPFNQLSTAEQRMLKKNEVPITDISRLVKQLYEKVREDI